MMNDKSCVNNKVNNTNLCRITIAHGGVFGVWNYGYSQCSCVQKNTRIKLYVASPLRH